MDKIPHPTFQCEGCGATALRSKSFKKNGLSAGYHRKQRFCTKDCGLRNRKFRPINPEGYKHSSGYMRVHTGPGKRDLKHRMIMVDDLGRPLTEFESVHHKNGNKTDNRLENLELWSRFQPPGQRVVDKVQYAIEILTQYPDFARQAGYVLHPISHVSVDPPAL